MRECKTPDVPSFSALRKKQAELTKNVNIKTTHHVSAMGNEFYMNHPAELLALVRDLINFHMYCSNFGRIGPIPWSENLYRCIQRSQTEFQSSGSPKSGPRKWILMISLPCEQTGKELVISIFTSRSLHSCRTVNL
jgi:hypothetical protein